MVLAVITRRILVLLESAHSARRSRTNPLVSLPRFGWYGAKSRAHPLLCPSPGKIRRVIATKMRSQKSPWQTARTLTLPRRSEAAAQTCRSCEMPAQKKDPNGHIQGLPPEELDDVTCCPLLLLPTAAPNADKL